MAELETPIESWALNERLREAYRYLPLLRRSPERDACIECLAAFESLRNLLAKVALVIRCNGTGVHPETTAESLKLRGQHVRQFWLASDSLRAAFDGLSKDEESQLGLLAKSDVWSCEFRHSLREMSMWLISARDVGLADAEAAEEFERCVLRWDRGRTLTRPAGTNQECQNNLARKSNEFARLFVEAFREPLEIERGLARNFAPLIEPESQRLRSLESIEREAAETFSAAPICGEKGSGAQDPEVKLDGTDWLRIVDVERLTGINRGVVSRLVAAGDLRDNKKVGKHRRVARDSVLRYCNEKEIEYGPR